MATKSQGSLKKTDVVLITSVNLASEVTGVLPVANGGTNTGTYTNGQLLIGQTSGNTLAKAVLSGDVTMDQTGAVTIATNKKKKTISITFDGGGSAPTANTKAYLVCPISGTIVGWRIVGDLTGSAVVDVWKIAYGASLPTVANTIAALAKPTLSSAKINKDDTLTGWTTSVTADDIFGFNLDSCSTITRLVVEIIINP